MTIPTREQMTEALNIRQGEELVSKLQNTTVAILGLGGLGSNIAIALARAGIGKLILADFDRVDVTNLHRQQYKACQVGEPKANALADNLREIAPYIELETHVCKVDESNYATLLREADIVCEAFDNAEAKAMIVNCVLENMPDKYLVASSGMAGLGSVNTIKTRRVMNRFYLSGDGVSDVNDGIGLVAPRVMICAAHQAHTVIRIVNGDLEV